MKKGILIVGKRESGKSWLSQLLTSETPKKNIYRIDGRNMRDHFEDDLKHCLCNKKPLFFFCR
jgi:predicted AAA+ superfamily ATPase